MQQIFCMFDKGTEFTIVYNINYRKISSCRKNYELYVLRTFKTINSNLKLCNIIYTY